MKKGMNPDAVEQLSSTVTDGIDQTTQFFSAAQDALESLDWTGDDQSRFLSEFQEFGEQVQSVCQAAGELAERLMMNAQQQRQASS